jgi:hypothetical protein
MISREKNEDNFYNFLENFNEEERDTLKTYIHLGSVPIMSWTDAPWEEPPISLIELESEASHFNALNFEKELWKKYIQYYAQNVLTEDNFSITSWRQEKNKNNFLLSSTLKNIEANKMIKIYLEIIILYAKKMDMHTMILPSELAWITDNGQISISESTFINGTLCTEQKSLINDDAPLDKKKSYNWFKTIMGVAATISLFLGLIMSFINLFKFVNNL